MADPGCGDQNRFDEIIQGLNSIRANERLAASEELLHGIETGEIEITEERVDALFNCVTFMPGESEAWINSLSWIVMHEPEKVPMDKVHRIAVWFAELDPDPNPAGTMDLEESYLLILKYLKDDLGEKEMMRVLSVIDKYRGHKLEILREAANEIWELWCSDPGSPDCQLEKAMGSGEPDLESAVEGCCCQE